MKKFLGALLLSFAVAITAGWFIFNAEARALGTILRMGNHSETFRRLASIKESMPTPVDLTLLALGTVKTRDLAGRILNHFPRRGELSRLADDLPDREGWNNLERLLSHNEIIGFLCKLLPREKSRGIADFQKEIRDAGGLSRLLARRLPPPFVMSATLKALPDDLKSELFTAEEYHLFISRLPQDEMLDRIGEMILLVEIQGEH